MRERHPVRRVLYEPPLFFGLPKPVLILECTFALAFVVGFGVSWESAGVIALLVLVVHPALAFFTRDDPEVLTLFWRNYRLPEFLDPLPSYGAKKLPSYRTVPSKR